jgi:hypothetical protein
MTGGTGPVVPRKPYVQRDIRYVSEYVDQNYPHDKVFFNLRLGPPPIGVAEKYPGVDVNRYARVWKKTCDAVVVTDKEVVLIEGELRRPLLALGELVIYRDLLFQTPELVPYQGHTVRSILLCPVYDPTLDLQLREHKIEAAVFRPKWVDDYLKEVMR